MSDIDPLRNLAQTLAPDTTVPVTMTKGVVTGYTITGQPPTVAIQLSGDTTTTIDGVRFLDSYSPAIGDVVQVIKQGPMLLVVGQIAGGADAVANGWQTPALTSTWNSNTSATPARYRLVVDNGARKVQFMGRVYRNGSGTLTTMFTLPAGYQPSVIRSMVAARENLSNGSNVIMVQALTNGNVEISGQTLGAVGGNVGTTNAAGNYGYDQLNNPLVSLKHTQGIDTSQDPQQHTHHFSHTHTVTVPSASFPGWVALDGLEFFL